MFVEHHSLSDRQGEVSLYSTRVSLALASFLLRLLTLCVSEREYGEAGHMDATAQLKMSKDKLLESFSLLPCGSQGQNSGSRDRQGTHLPAEPPYEPWFELF